MAIELRPDSEIVDFVASTLVGHLQAGERVLWLVPGGSAIAKAVEVSHRLTRADTSRLFITLTDERYGELGHKDENWPQIESAGFRFGDAQVYRVLTGDSIEQTVEKFSGQLEQWLSEVDYSIGLFGIGADGHTAGIKPGSVAVESQASVESFRGADFERITITPRVVARLDETVAYARGIDKFPALRRLVNEDLSIVEQPAQCLKLANRVTLFSDLN